MRDGPRVRIDVNKRSADRFDESEEQRLQRVQSRDSDTATMNFVTDDRMQEEHEEYSAFKEAYEEEESREYVIENGVKRLVNQHYDSRGYSKANRGNKGHREEERRRNMAVDYSSNDFRQSLAAIDQASRDGAHSREDGVRVRHIGDTTIMTEHRDPYSFYWQLDQQRRETESPPRHAPPTDYVIDEEEEVVDTVLSPESHDSGIMFENQYRRPHRGHPLPPPPPIMEEEPKDLPPGWEKHQDPQGFSYYWHVDSGTIQRQPPPPVRDVTPARTPTPPPAPVYSVTTASRETQADAPPTQIIQLPPQQPVIEEHAFKQTTTKRRIEQDEMSEGFAEVEEQGDTFNKPVRFQVRSLGWIEISEDELTAEKSSRAVNRAIIDLTTRMDLDNIPKWGDGRELYMELDDNELALLDPENMTVIHSERIQAIRVWGVGRDNGRDFAYVSRDRGTRRFMCHVFRCDTAAKTIANALRDICKRIMLHRRPSSLHAIESSGEKRIVRSEGLSAPVEEPRKVIRCHFLGVTQVPKATGIEILNEAVDRLVSQVRPERWILADVSIAPSTIAIVEVNGQQIAECRVRYLSFLGIGRDVKHCAFIMQTSSENFMCYVFHVEPSAAAMAKMIEAACKLRYQKVLDAHGSSRHHSGMSQQGHPPPPSSYHGLD